MVKTAGTRAESE